ncbi:unnamed protein product [Oikopleura dioica]|uniref:One cut domain family member n=1 Tax=Oikopleura dioica TaxID=34765 RepID=Q5EVF6_OIKDI|nr:HNF6b [Oikopleura dioica]CBY10499.1 unnamed protein product [Oikopleura dioica]
MIELSYIPQQLETSQPMKTETFSFMNDYQEIKQEATYQPYEYITAFPVGNDPSFASFTPEYSELYTNSVVPVPDNQNSRLSPVNLPVNNLPQQQVTPDDQTKIYLPVQHQPQTTYIATSIPEGSYQVFEEIPTDFSHASNSPYAAYPISLSLTPPVSNSLPTTTTYQNTPTSESSSTLPMDTKQVAEDILAVLKRYSIPQSVFANKILGRSQGTLSDLLRNPKPWDKLKAGRETFRRMEQWLQQPEMTRVTELQQATRIAGSMKQTREANSQRQRQKKIRRIFTDAQRRILHSVFKTNNRPTKEHQMALAEELNLELSTVSNFFMNARRRRLSPV